MQNLSLASAFKFGPKHYNNVRNSINFAFNASRMSPPANIKTLQSQEALATLKTCRKSFEL